MTDEPNTAEVTQAEALVIGERFLEKCNSAWACGEPAHRVRAMLDAADAFDNALADFDLADAILAKPQPSDRADQQTEARATSGAGVPDGWKLVPVTLTPEMAEAAVHLDCTATHDPLWPEYWTALLSACPTEAPGSEGAGLRTIAEQLEQALHDKSESRFNAIAFVRRHEIIAALRSAEA